MSDYLWKKKSEARQDVFQYYLAFLFEQLEDKNEVEIRLRKLSRLSNGKLQEEPDEDWIFELVESEDEQ